MRDFSVYQSFGGKLGVAAKSVTYTVFLPTDFGFNQKTDRLQLEIGRVGGGMSVVDDTGTKSNTACQPQLGGTACSVTWGFDDRLEEGEYQVSFKVLDNTTHQKGRVFVKILGGSPAVYAEGGATVFIRKPLTSPYVEVSGMNDGTLHLSKATGLRDYPISVGISSAYNATSATVAIDGQTVDQTSDSLPEDNSSYYMGKAQVFTLNISKQTLESLALGSHTITVTIAVPGYGDVTAQIGGKERGLITVVSQ